MYASLRSKISIFDYYERGPSTLALLSLSLNCVVIYPSFQFSRALRYHYTSLMLESSDPDWGCAAKPRSGSLLESIHQVGPLKEFESVGGILYFFKGYLFYKTCPPSCQCFWIWNFQLFQFLLMFWGFPSCTLLFHPTFINFEKNFILQNIWLLEYLLLPTKQQIKTTRNLVL